jgi:hypothetical protein
MSTKVHSAPTGKPLPLPKESPYQKVKNFVSKNRQQLINIIGVYFVFSYAVHNYRIKLAWDDLELEFKELQLEVDRIKDALQDEEWTSNIESEIRRTKASTDSGILLDQIKLKINPITESLAESVTKRSLSNEEGDMSIVLGIYLYIFLSIYLVILVNV